MTAWRLTVFALVASLPASAEPPPSVPRVIDYTCRNGRLAALAVELPARAEASVLVVTIPAAICGGARL